MGPVVPLGKSLLKLENPDETIKNQHKQGWTSPGQDQGEIKV